jgi:predicted RNA-binding protein YlxR (DUF448 family)
VARVKKIPQRMCVGCREMKNKKDMIRIVRTPELQVIIDRTGKKSGRGAYVCPRLECLAMALKGKRLQKALEIDIPGEVIEALEKELVTD